MLVAGLSGILLEPTFSVRGSTYFSLEMTSALPGSLQQECKKCAEVLKKTKKKKMAYIPRAALLV